MNARHGCALLGLLLVGCGQGIGEEPTATALVSKQVSTQACTPGVAERVKVVIPPGTNPSPFNGPFPESLVDVQGTLFFAVNFNDGRSILWKSNGTESGTVPVKAFEATTPARRRDLSGLVAAGRGVFFQMWSPDTGNELWVSDGTEGGTHLVKDLMPGAEDSRLAHVTGLGGIVAFFRLIEVMSPPRTQVELWRSDGTSAGTVRVANFGVLASLQERDLKVDGALLFFLSDPSSGTALWRTNGTTSGTALVKRLDAGVVPVVDVSVLEGGEPGLFTLRDGPNTEVWKTNGTTGGTVRLDAFGKDVRMIGALSSGVYLTYPDPATRRMSLYRLSLGGGGKTTVAVLANPYVDLPDSDPYLQTSVVSGGKVYFSVAISSGGPSPRTVGLWVTDGTAAQTRQLPGFLSTSDMYWSPLYATGSGGVLFSAAPSNLSTTRPWVTRGTVATTAPVTQRVMQTASSPAEYTRSGSKIFFRANDETAAAQLWAVPANIACTPDGAANH